MRSLLVDTAAMQATRGFVCVDLAEEMERRPSLTSANQLHWRCASGHYFRASLSLLARSVQRSCPTCEVRQLLAELEQEMPVRLQTIEPVDSKSSADGRYRGLDWRSSATPQLGSGVFRASWRCPAAHAFETTERLQSGSHGSTCYAKLGQPSGSHTPGGGSWSTASNSWSYLPARACPTCRELDQKRMFERAAADFYSGGRQGSATAQTPRRHAAPSSSAGSGDASAVSAEAESARVLALQPGALPALILGLPLSYNLESARRRYHALAKAMHPDKSKLPQCQEAFKRVSQAFRAIDESLRT